MKSNLLHFARILAKIESRRASLLKMAFQIEMALVYYASLENNEGHCTAPGKNHLYGRNVPEVIRSLTSVTCSLGLKKLLCFGSDFQV